MKQSAANKIPFEIWGIILSYVTTSSLLPFTENGKVSSSLVDTIDLFSDDCRVFQAHRDDTQATVERLRLVCRAWAKLLQRAVNWVAHTNFATYYFPSENSIGSAQYLWVGKMTVGYCEDHRNIPKQAIACGHTQLKRRAFGITSDIHQDLRLQMFSSNLKILFWNPIATQSLDLPMKSLGSVMALSVFPNKLPSQFSLNELFSSAPRLSHLHIQIMRRSEHLLSEQVEISSLSYLSLEIDIPKAYKGPRFMPWVFPRLRALSMRTFLPIEYRADFEKFLSNHGKNIVELKACGFRYIGHAGSAISPISRSLWEICPNITTVGLNISMSSLVQWLPKSEWQTQGTRATSLTLLMYDVESSWESDLDDLVRLKKQLNVQKVVLALSWRERDQREGSSVKARVYAGLGGPKSRAKKLLERLSSLGVLMVDKYGYSLTDYLTTFAESYGNDDPKRNTEAWLKYLNSTRT
jgi:hypothetical protein